MFYSCLYLDGDNLQSTDFYVIKFLLKSLLNPGNESSPLESIASTVKRIQSTKESDHRRLNRFDRVFYCKEQKYPSEVRQRLCVLLDPLLVVLQVGQDPA